MSADLLRRAAAHLRNPYRCNGNPWDLPVADLLDAHAESIEEEGPHFSVTSDVAAAFAVAQAILPARTPMIQRPGGAR